MSTDAGAPHTDLPADAGRVLLPLARNAIAARLGAAAAPVPAAAWLRARGASFVTLTLDGRLRGCIGTLEAHRALADDVAANAQSAAFGDPRFPPLTAAEQSGVHLEVSVLSTPAAMAWRDEDDALAQLRPGVDGLILEYGFHRSTFLPQVWDEFGDARTFVNHLKYKAGLPPDFWDPAVKLARYTVVRWREGADG